MTNEDISIKFISSINWRHTNSYILGYERNAYNVTHERAIKFYNTINNTSFTGFTDEEEMLEFIKIYSKEFYNEYVIILKEALGL